MRILILLVIGLMTTTALAADFPEGRFYCHDCYKRVKKFKVEEWDGSHKISGKMTFGQTPFDFSAVLEKGSLPGQLIGESDFTIIYRWEGGYRKQCQIPYKLDLRWSDKDQGYLLQYWAPSWIWLQLEWGWKCPKYEMSNTVAAAPFVKCETEDCSDRMPLPPSRPVPPPFDYDEY